MNNTQFGQLVSAPHPVSWAHAGSIVSGCVCWAVHSLQALHAWGFSCPGDNTTQQSLSPHSLSPLDLSFWRILSWASAQAVMLWGGTNRSCKSPSVLDSEVTRYFFRHSLLVTVSQGQPTLKGWVNRCYFIMKDN